MLPALSNGIHTAVQGRDSVSHPGALAAARGTVQAIQTVHLHMEWTTAYLLRLDVAVRVAARLIQIEILHTSDLFPKMAPKSPDPAPVTKPEPNPPTREAELPLPPTPPGSIRLGR